MRKDELLAGVAEVDITPPIGDPMDGYIARQGNSVGVHDPLLAQALLLSLDQEYFLLLTLDLLGVSLDFAQRVRSRISEVVGLDEAEIMLACTHTHSGPAGFLPRMSQGGAREDLELQNITLRKLVGATCWAYDGLQPAQMGLEEGVITSIGRNRNDPEDGPLDPTLTVWRVDGAGGEPLAVVMNYGCHPTVLGYKNRYISADYPGAARRLLQEVYPDTVFLFTNGASGDVSTRFTRRGQTFAEVERMGRILAGEVLRRIQLIEATTPSHVSSLVLDVEIPLRDFPSPQTAREMLADYQAELVRMDQSVTPHGDIRRMTTKVEGAQAQVRLVESFADHTHIATQVQVVRIGDLLCVGLPGEPLSRLVLDLKEKSPSPWTIVVSYANDDVGYLPDERTITQGSYEALSSPYGLSGVRHLRQMVLSLMDQSQSSE